MDESAGHAVPGEAMNTKHPQPANPIPEKYFRPFVLPSPRLRAEDVLELLLAKTSGGSLDAKAALLTISNACTNLELSHGQKVRDASDFREFFQEMANRLAEATPIETAPLPKE